MRSARSIARIRGPVAFWAAAGVALLASHDAVFLAQVGPGQALVRALREAGHGYWALASVLLALAGAVALAATIIRLRGLRQVASALGAGHVARSRSYARRWLAAWSRLLALVAIGFVLQENAEHLIQHGHAPGLGALLGPEYPLALPVISVITALAALVAAVLSQAELTLLEAIAHALRAWKARAPRSLPRPPLRLALRRLSPMARAAAGRAPPRAFVSAT